MTKDTIMSHDTISFSIPKRTVYGAVCVCLGGLLAGVGVSYADDLRTTQTVVGTNLVVPYDGYLMLDSEALTGAQEIRFEIFESSSGGMAEWTETQTVTLHSGRFSVGLGSVEPLTDTLLDAEQLWLAMTVIDASGTEVELSGRQTIEAAPYAAWAASSSNFQVAGDLNVEGTADIDGDRLEFGASNARALFENGSNQLYISPNQGHPGGVYFGNDVTMNYTGTVLGTFSTRADSTLGNATSDPTEISGDLTVNVLSTFESALNTEGNVTLGNASGDTITSNGPLYANEGITLTNSADILNGDVIQGFNDLRLRRSSSSNTNDIFVASGGNVTIANDLTVSGDVDNFTLSGTYTTDAENTQTDTDPMLVVGNNICWLDEVDIKGLDNDSQRGRCWVAQLADINNNNAVTWFLVARSENNGGPVNCDARCLSW